MDENEVKVTEVEIPVNVNLVRSKLTVCIGISLMQEVVKLTVGKCMPNNLDMSDVAPIAASTLSAHLNV